VVKRRRISFREAMKLGVRGSAEADPLFGWFFGIPLAVWWWVVGVPIPKVAPPEEAAE